jgi:hypothetical protein
MNKIASFEDFKKSKASSIKEDHDDIKTEHSGEQEHYMFFQNLASIKHHIEEILKMNPEQIDNLLKNGHDWASDHIATSKDDIQEVAEWIRNEMENPGHDEERGEEEEHPEPEVDNIVVNIEDGNDDEEEDEEGDDEDEEGEDEEEEEEEA